MGVMLSGHPWVPVVWVPCVPFPRTRFSSTSFCGRPGRCPCDPSLSPLLLLLLPLPAHQRSHRPASCLPSHHSATNMLYSGQLLVVPLLSWQLVCWELLPRHLSTENLYLFHSSWFVISLVWQVVSSVPRFFMLRLVFPSSYYFSASLSLSSSGLLGSFLSLLVLLLLLNFVFDSLALFFLLHLTLFA